MPPPFANLSARASFLRNRRLLLFFIFLSHTKEKRASRKRSIGNGLSPRYSPSLSASEQTIALSYLSFLCPFPADIREDVPHAAYSGQETSIWNKISTRLIGYPRCPCSTAQTLRPRSEILGDRNRRRHSTGDTSPPLSVRQLSDAWPPCGQKATFSLAFCHSGSWRELLTAALLQHDREEGARRREKQKFNAKKTPARSKDSGTRNPKKDGVK